MTKSINLVGACLLFVASLTGEVCGVERRFANVPPTLEIEVLDPGVDPNGNPAVRLETGEYGELSVDIPPVVLVHRYYYSGDRSFQGPMLPGGPSILVVNHPKTGERLYIPTQMMPGAPRVTYTAHRIEYDYGEHAIALHFGWTGKPSVKYRSGRTWSEKLNDALHVDQVKQHARAVKSHSHLVAANTKTMIVGITADAADAAESLTLPIQNTIQILPFGKAIFGGDLQKQFAESAAKHQRDKEIRRAQHERELSELDIATNR